MTVLSLDSAIFEKEIKNGVSIIKFSADWCRPCLAFAPIFEEFSLIFEHYRFYSVDIEKNSSVAQKYKVFSIPTIIVFKDGVKISSKTGMMDKISFKNWMDEIESLRSAHGAA
jgi:thioredoxin 1